MNEDQFVFHSIPAPLIVIDLDRRITLLNRAAEVITGYATSEVHNRSICDLLCCTHARAESCSICAVSETFVASVAQGSVGNYLRHGSILTKGQKNGQPVYFKVSPVTDLAGSVRGLILLLCPETSQEWTTPHPIDLFGLFVHQLRTYMTYIGSSAEAMMHGYSHFDSPQEGLRFIQEQAERSAAVLNQGLALIRVLRESSFGIEPISLASVVHAVVEGLEARHGGHNVSIVLPPEDGVLGNRLLIELILENLLQNAIVHSDDHSGITITAEAEGEKMRVTVADRGKGIHDVQLQRLFQPPGQPISGSALSDFHGMGLLLTKVAVESQGGEIWAESQPSVGSCFHFSLRKHVRRAH